MTFLWPLALLALLLVPLALVGYVLVQRRRVRYAMRFTNLDLLGAVVDSSPRAVRRHLPALLALLALTLLLAALARPQAVIAVPKEQATVVLTMDVSGSMAAEDVEPTRIEAARAAAKDFLDEVPDGFRVGIVGFSSAPHVALSPTDDRDAAAQLNRERVALCVRGAREPVAQDAARRVDTQPTPGLDVDEPELAHVRKLLLAAVADLDRDDVVPPG